MVTNTEKHMRQQANEALSRALKEFGGYDKHWITRFDYKENELFYFFPLAYVESMGPRKKDFIRILRKHWKKAGFKVDVYKEFPANDVFEISCNSLLFCIK